MNEYDSYGLWNVAGYFLSDDMSASEIAASNYRSLMNGDNYGREVSAINSWRSKDQGIVGEYRDLTTYLWCTSSMNIEWIGKQKITMGYVM